MKNKYNKINIWQNNQMLEKKWNCKNEIVKMKFSFFLRNEIKTHFFCKKSTEIIAGKRNKKK